MADMAGTGGTGTGGTSAAPATLGLSEPDDAKRMTNWHTEHDASAAAMITEFNRVQQATPRIKDYLTAYAAVIVDALKVAADQEKAHLHIKA